LARFLPLHHVSDHLRLEPEEPGSIYQTRILVARHVDHRRRGVPSRDGQDFRCLEHTTRISGAARLSRLCVLLRNSWISAIGSCESGHSSIRYCHRGRMRRRYCLTLDLKNDPKLIAEYKRYHERIWPEITRSIK